MTRKLKFLLPALFVPGLLITNKAISGSAGAGATDASADAIITATPTHGSKEVSRLASNDVLAYIGKNRTQVTSLEPLEGDQAGMQLFIFLDDSTRGGVLGTKIGELKSFVTELPASTQVAIGYMRNGGFDLRQGFTADHQKAAEKIRLPESQAGVNGSPYFALSYLVKHWPSEQPSARRAVLMLTDGVDRYYGNLSTDDPYVDAAIKDSQRLGVLVYSIYLQGAGLYSTGGWGVNMAQSRLEQVSQATGGQSYTEGFDSPVSLLPYLKQLNERLNHQYRVTFVVQRNSGLQHVEFKTEVPGVKILAPQQVAVKGA